MHISGASKAWRILDTRNYTLPHRRQRVWGLAAVNTGATAESDFSDRFCGFLQAASSHWNFSKEQLFPNLEKEDPKEGRHAGLVAHAREKFAGCDNIYIDCSSSWDREVSSAFASPCITPTHPIYSTVLERYLKSVDLMKDGYLEEFTQRLASLRPIALLDTSGNFRNLGSYPADHSIAFNFATGGLYI